MRQPRIGLNCDIPAAGSGVEIAKVNWDYIRSVAEAGGLPVLLPPLTAAAGGHCGVDQLRNPPPVDTHARNVVEEFMCILDGLVLTGGRDYDPALYGEPRHPMTNLLDERRSRFDVALARAAIARGMPVLGICGGAQLINIALGGTLIQHLPDAVGDAIAHQWTGADEPFHEVEVVPGSRLAAIVGAGRLRVNSSHHQAVGRVGEGLRIVARAPDGAVEAIEGMGTAFLLGVQWHPERMRGQAEQLALFRALIQPK